MALIAGNPIQPKSSGLKGWLEENISKKGIKRSLNRIAADQKREMAKEVVPGITQGDLYSGLPAGGLKFGGKRLLKAAKEANEEMITVYRGVDKWYKGSMVKKGRFVGNYQRGTPSERGAFHTAMTPYVSGQYAKGAGVLLKFEVPKSYVLKHGKSLGGRSMTNEHLDFLNDPQWEMVKNTRSGHIIFDKGLPKAFFKKVTDAKR